MNVQHGALQNAHGNKNPDAEVFGGLALMIWHFSMTVGKNGGGVAKW